jgi:hypothetical protein
MSLVATTLALGAGAGCQTAGEDLAEFAEALTPVTSSDAARWAVNPGDADLRRKGIVVIANSDIGGYEPYVKLYRDYAQNERDPIVRAVSIRALARHGAAEDAMIIAPNLLHEIVQVRWEAARGLQRLHCPDVVPMMLEVLRDEGQPAEIRAAVAIGLGQYPQDRVVQGLIAGLDAWELSVNRASAGALRNLTGRDFGLDARAWLGWYNQALAGGDPFAGRQEYLYPTYSRKKGFLESLSFWSSTTFEQPGTPAGLRPSTERRTYEEKPAEAATDGGPGG